MHVRPYRPADEPAVLSLWADALADPAPHNHPATSLRMKVEANDGLLFVAEVDGEVAGTVMGGYDGHRGWTYAVAVARHHRRKGVGSALVRHLEAELAARGCLKVNLQVRTSNAGVIAFYERCGFKVDAVISLGKRLYHGSDIVIRIRPEQPGDAASVFAVHAAAFPTDAEARLVDALRAAGKLAVSVVAEIDGRVVGHAAFSPVTAASGAAGLGLAPLAVLPELQRQGIGGALVRDGLERAKAAGVGWVVVLGHPAYYPRFGFRPAATVGLTDEYGGGDSFMAAELTPSALPVGAGLVKYGPEFAAFG